MELRTIVTERAPAAIGPYSQAIVADKMVYTAGQIPLDPTTLEVVQGGVVEQTEQIFKNLSAVLEAAGTSLQHVVKTTVFLSDMTHFTQMNEVYARHFGSHRPARTTVAVRELPKAVDVEIEAVAVLP